MLDPQDGTRDYDEERRERRNNVAVTRRRSRRDEETEERDERPTRRRRDRDEAPEEEPRRGRRSRDRDEEPEEERPTRRRSRSRDEEPEEEERPRRRGRRGGGDSGGSSRRGGTRGFGAYSSKKRASGDYANDFRPGENKKVLIKLLEDGPFDSYNQHWIKEMDRKSYVCLDDEEYFEDKGRDYLNEDGEIECPLCSISDTPKTYALFNVLDLSNERKPEVKVWSAPPTVADAFERAAREKKTSPLNREDVYFEVELQVKGTKKQWSIVPVLARDVEDFYDMEPFDADELEEFSSDLYDDRKAVTKVDTYDDLADIADEIMK